MMLREKANPAEVPEQICYYRIVSGVYGSVQASVLQKVYHPLDSKSTVKAVNAQLWERYKHSV